MSGPINLEPAVERAKCFFYRYGIVSGPEAYVDIEAQDLGRSVHVVRLAILPTGKVDDQSARNSIWLATDPMAFGGLKALENLILAYSDEMNCDGPENGPQVAEENMIWFFRTKAG